MRGRKGKKFDKMGKKEFHTHKMWEIRNEVLNVGFKPT